jgi:HD-like signal output (HDOD) protein
VIVGIFSILKEHAAMASGNFGAMFKDVEIPVLPASIANLLEELGKENPDMRRIEMIIATEPEIAAKIIRTVNSSLFALKSKVLSIRHAITLLGFRRIRGLLYGYILRRAVPRPEDSLFDHEAFWADTLIRSLLARTLANRYRPGEEEEAFTATLLADVAIPVLLANWAQYYAPVIETWKNSPMRLSMIEQSDFGWDHSQAGAWILQSWSFPEELICLTGTHNLAPDKIRELGLGDTIALPISVASLLPSVIKPDPIRADRLAAEAHKELGITDDDWPRIIDQVQNGFFVIGDQFNLSRDLVDAAIAGLNAVVNEGSEGE